MAKYEAMVIVNPNLNEEQKKEISAHVSDVIVKNQGEVVNLTVWSERRKLAYPMKKFQEGIYYLGIKLFSSIVFQFFNSLFFC